MMIFLVRWPTFEISFVAAKNEKDLLLKLEQIGDSTDCKYTPYTGEIYFGFRLNLQFNDKTDYNFTPVRQRAEINGIREYLKDGPIFEFFAEGGDLSDEMWDSVLEFSFPELWKLEKKLFNHDASEPRHKIQTRAAAIKELAAFFKGSEKRKDLNEQVKRRDQNGHN